MFAFRILFFVLFFGSFGLYGQRSKFKVYFNTVQFYEPSIGNYLELHFQFDAKYMKFLSNGNGLQATAYLKIEIKDSLGKSYFGRY